MRHVLLTGSRTSGVAFAAGCGRALGPFETWRADRLDELRQRIMLLLKDWAVRNDSPLPDFDDSDDLFELGVVDSMLMVEIVAAVEEATGSIVDFVEVDPEVFYTLSGIMTFAESAARREAPQFDA